MQIPSINQNQNNFKAVNQKYYQWAQKEVKEGFSVSSEILRQLRYEVMWKDIHPQDGIDTIEAIKDLIGGTGEFIEHVLETFRSMLKE